MTPKVSRLLQSFEFLNRGWDVRLLENQSLRSIFIFLLVNVFLLGALIFMFIYEAVHIHRFDWLSALLLIVLGAPAYRYSSLIFRRLTN